MSSKWEYVHTWAKERSRQSEFDSVSDDDILTVVIRKKSDFTLDMILNPERYNFILRMRKCRICKQPGHDSRFHDPARAL